MMHEPQKIVFSMKMKVLTVFIVLIDLYLFYRFSNFRSYFEYYLILTIAISSNVFYFIFLRFSFNIKPKQKNSIKLLMTMINDMHYAEPRMAEELIEVPSQEEVLEKGQEEVTKIEEETTQLEEVQKVVEIESITEVEIEKLESQSIIYDGVIFDNTIETHKYCDDLSQYLTDNGLSVDRNHIREMFASMATSKIIMIENANPIISEKFIKLFSQFIGSNLFIENVDTELESLKDLFSDNYNLKECIKTAHNNWNTINMMSLFNVEINNFQHYFDPIIECALNPLLPCEIKYIDLTHNKQLPNNIWFFVILDQSDPFVLSEKLLQSSVLLELNAKIINRKAVIQQNEIKLSYENLTNLLVEGFEHYYLEEEEWKKIDQVEQYFKEHSTFSLDNRLFRQLERYTSTFLMFGGDKKEAIDSVLFSKMLRLLTIVELNENIETKEDVLLLFEKLFGLEFLNKSKKLLKIIQERNQQIQENQEI